MCKKLQSELDELIKRLDESAKNFQRETLDPSLIPDRIHWQREGVAQAIGAIFDFLQIHCSGDTLKPLTELLGAIADVGAGRYSPILHPDIKADSEPRKPVIESARIALAAIIIDLMIQAGWKKKHALKRVASKVGLISKQLDSRRYDLRRQKGDKQAVELYQKWIVTFGQADDPTTMIEAYLEKLE